MDLEKQLGNYPYKLILGSASPRRKELLKNLGFHFEVQVISADESHWPQELRGPEIPLYLARVKAEAFGRELQPQELLITADTVVWMDGRVFNKPSGPEEAFEMLRSLSGHRHQVHTAVCLRSQTKTVSFCDTADVDFKSLSDEEIRYYIKTCKPFDKAGAYGVQEWLGYIGIEQIQGSFYTIMGLPLKPLFEHLIRF